MPSPTDNNAPRLIAGMPRAATTWLCRCFNEHRDTAAFGETLYWGRCYVEPHGLEGAGRYTPQQVNAVLDRLKTGECITSVDGRHPGALRNVTHENIASVFDRARQRMPERPTPGELFLAVCSAIKEAEGKAIIVEKSPHHINWLDRIMSAIPGVKVVALVREPYSFMLSYKHQGDRKGDRVKREFDRRYHPLACALVWRTCMKAARSAAERFPRQILVVENEDIRRDPGAVLDRVQAFYELPHATPGGEIAAKVAPENTSFPQQEGKPAAKPALRGEDIFWMNLIAGRTIRAAGYEPRSVPREPIRIAWSFLRLPVWAIWNIFSMKRRVRGSLIAYLWRWVYSPRSATENHGEERMDMDVKATR